MTPLEERIALLPVEPGVYLFRDADARVLYVGKAQSLRARVRSYFNRGGDGRMQVPFLVERIADVEVIATANVKEALLLENQLIKQHKPRFNVRLRDDKNYLALRLDPEEPYPRFTETRRFARDGALYFGPYTSSLSLRETLATLQRIFPLRTCSDPVFRSYRRQGRPCLEHSIGRCAAPCCGRISDEAYGELVSGAALFMRGKAEDLLAELKQRMRAAAEAERFEEAGRLRDRVRAVERTVESQAMVSRQFVDRDAFGIAREGPRLEIQALHVRQGKIAGSASYQFRDVAGDDAEALGSFLTQFYAEREIPREVLVPVELESAAAFEELWRERAGHAVEIALPKRGERRRLVELATRNAALALQARDQKEQNTAELLESVREALRLERVPVTIECYDISHLQGSLGVASRVSFVDARPNKAGYRKYKLRETQPGDDYGAMREVLRRRLERLESEPAPDLLLLDGGKGQLNAARALFTDLGVEGIALASLAKERDEESASPRVLRHGGQKREKLFLPAVKDPILLATDSPALLLLQRVRDESHRFAISYHRELRRKSQFRSILDELPGIGPTRRRALLRHLGSLEKVRAATLEELAAVPKLGRRAAAIVHRFFHPEVPAEVTPPELTPSEVTDGVKSDTPAADPTPESDLS
ncbi:MAG TPA: excinuclease ABC subunit UvrC [Myxococcota bacterium]|nr:excinuclease ABC subunit UvrC [Myxococcota bacterium]